MAIDWDALVIGPCVATFGEAVVYWSASGAVLTITGVFDEAYREMKPLSGGAFGMEGFDLGSPGAISTERPVLGVQLSQFNPPVYPEQGDGIVIRGQTYVVKEVRADSHGHALLLLNEAHPS